MMACVRRAVFLVVIAGAAGGCTSKRDDSNRLVNQALEKHAQGDVQTAKSKLQLAIATDATNARAYRERAAILSKEGRPAEAIPDFEKAVDLNPDNPQWRYELAGKYWEVYRASAGLERESYLPKIEEHVTKAIERNGTLADYFLLRARCRKALSAFKGAAQDYRKAIDLDPINADPYLELGRLYGLMWRILYRDDLFNLAEQALSTSSRLAELPNLPTESETVLPEMGFELGKLYAAKGDVEEDAGVADGFFEKAISVFRSIDSDYRDRTELNLQLAQVYQRRGDTQNACTAAEEAIRSLGADPAGETRREYVMHLGREMCGVSPLGFDPNR